MVWPYTPTNLKTVKPDAVKKVPRNIWQFHCGLSFFSNFLVPSLYRGLLCALPKEKNQKKFRVHENVRQKLYLYNKFWVRVCVDNHSKVPLSHSRQNRPKFIVSSKFYVIPHCIFSFVVKLLRGGISRVSLEH